ncbi:Conserved_hypothetical protein [Hexamita inflata]|uniref:Uncharacterized protein n=1 Tax=Hexamita inflata TaxID=28002 RepID=A0AA86N9F4_9EUKA|nr:Conserved hypothetical protein [Hexamita inflata]
MENMFDSSNIQYCDSNQNQDGDYIFDQFLTYIQADYNIMPARSYIKNTNIVKIISLQQEYVNTTNHSIYLARNLDIRSIINPVVFISYTQQLLDDDIQCFRSNKITQIIINIPSVQGLIQTTYEQIFEAKLSKAIYLAIDSLSSNQSFALVFDSPSCLTRCQSPIQSWNCIVKTIQQISKINSAQQIYSVLNLSSKYDAYVLEPLLSSVFPVNDKYVILNRIQQLQTAESKPETVCGVNQMSKYTLISKQSKQKCVKLAKFMQSQQPQPLNVIRISQKQSKYQQLFDSVQNHSVSEHNLQCVRKVYSRQSSIILIANLSLATSHESLQSNLHYIFKLTTLSPVSDFNLILINSSTDLRSFVRHSLFTPSWTTKLNLAFVNCENDYEAVINECVSLREVFICERVEELEKAWGIMVNYEIKADWGLF